MSTTFWMCIISYLLAGSLSMLLANELLRGGISRREFSAGMILWLPLVIGYLLGMPLPRVKS